MKKSIRIVLLSVDDFSDGRKVSEHIADNTYPNTDEALKDILSKEGLETAGVGIYTPCDFSATCNEQEINLEHFWVSYIFIKE